MSNAKSRIFAAVAAALSVGTAAWAQSTPQDQKIEQLEAKVASLEAKQAAGSKELAATVEGMLRDAEKRSHLLATNGDLSAGYDGGFFIKSGDAWVLRPGIQMQFRNVTNYREDAKEGGDDSVMQNGFEIRRLRFFFAGSAFTPNLTYYFEWDTDRNGAGVNLNEAWAKYFFADEWGIKAGQFKDLATHEFLTSTKRQLAADLSLVDTLIGGTIGDYTQGVTLIYGGERHDNNPLALEAGYTDGAAQRNTNFTNRGEPPLGPAFTDDYTKPVAHAFDFGVAGRAEFKVMGSWVDYQGFTAKGARQQLLVFGGGGDWSQGGDGNMILGSVDAQYENPNGFGAYAAGLVKYRDKAITGTDSTTDLGFLIQASYAFSGNWEVFGRYDGTWLDDAAVFAANGHTQDNFHEITVGVNYYMGNNGDAMHRAKFTVDLSYLPNGAPRDETGIDVLGNNGFEAEWMLRAQFQLVL
jgi:hypothetical protein